jgi:hypothetical protein
MGNRHIVAILNGEPVPPLAAPGVLAIADGDEPEGQDHFMIEDLAHDGAVGAGDHALPVVGDDVVVVERNQVIREIDMREREANGFTIKYDGGSHSSHIVRAYIKCKAHSRCFKYRQTNLDADARSRHAVLLAWAGCGPDVTRIEHVDPRFAPSDGRLAIAFLDAPE